MTQTHYQLVLDTRYAARVTLLLARFHGRLAGGLSFIEILLGATAIGSWLASHSGGATSSAAVMACITAFNYAYQPARRAWDARNMHAAYVRLNGEALGLGKDVLLQRLNELRASDPTTEPEALRTIAYNDSLLENGHSDILIPEDRMAKFWRVIA